MKYLVVGLGNIGVEYNETRHNIGFDIVSGMAYKYQVEFESDKYASVATFRLKNKIVTLIKPTTYMNLSGKAYNVWLNKLKLTPEKSIVVVDDLALDFCQIRIKKNGSSAGHNGLKNIEEVLGHRNYPRLKFGIGDHFVKGFQVDYVLGKWNQEERKELPFAISKSIDAIEETILSGISNAMNKFNNK